MEKFLSNYSEHIPKKDFEGTTYTKLRNIAVACLATWTLAPSNLNAQQASDADLSPTMEKLNALETTIAYQYPDTPRTVVPYTQESPLKFEIITDAFLSNLSVELGASYGVSADDVHTILNDIHASCGRPDIIGHHLPNIRAFEGGPLNIIFLPHTLLDPQEKLSALLGELAHAQQFRDHPYRSSLLALLSYGRAGIITCVKRDQDLSFLAELQQHYTDFAYDEKTGSKLRDLFSALEREAHEYLQPQLQAEFDAGIQALQESK